MPIGYTFQADSGPMPEISTQIEVPHRALFKAAEVCDLVKVQPYVLRSWESEFPDLGVAKTEGAPRVYRRADVEQVLRIKHLLLVEGLTLAGARRKLEDEGSPAVADASPIGELVGRNARERLTAIKRGLRSILDLLSQVGQMPELRLTAPTVGASGAPRAARQAAPQAAGAARARSGTPTRAKASRGKSSLSRRKRST